MYVSNLLTKDCILAIGDNLKSLSLERSSELTKGIALKCICDLQQFKDVSPFFDDDRTDFMDNFL